METGEPQPDAPTASELVVRDELAAHLTLVPHRSAMRRRFGLLVRWLSSLLFAHVLFEKRGVEVLQRAAAKGTPVYVMHVESVVDYLYFNYAFAQNNLPLALWANGVSTSFFAGFWTWLTTPFRRAPDATPEAHVESLARAGLPVFLFLGKRRQRADQRLEHSQRFLFRLIRAQRDSPAPFQVIPLLVFWERRPEPEHIGVLGDIFGTGQSPGLFRKTLGVFQTVWQSYFNLGQPMARVSPSIDLQEFLDNYPDAGSADASELLRNQLEERFAQERQVILGPTPRGAHETRRAITARPEILELSREIAAREGTTEDKIQARVRKQLREIAADQSLLVVKIFSLLLGLVWYRIYDGIEVDEAGLERVREAGKTGSLILIPSHKSHVDYLIISYLFYHYGLMPPHIAAGINLSFFPLGPIFRRCGAFFLRRSFQGEDLYPAVFREYLIQLMRQGYPIEFFIEGTRSRTGKLVKPRYGMLEMIARAHVTGRVEGVKLVPISVGYEKVIEERAHAREALGAEKTRESLSELLKTPRFLRSRYGRLNVEFGEPIDLGEYMKRYGLEPMAPLDVGFDALVIRLAHRIIYDINAVTAVTPASLVALVLLAHPNKHMSRERFLGDVGFVLDLLLEPGRDTRLARTLLSAVGDAQGLLGAIELLPGPGPEEQAEPAPSIEEAPGARQARLGRAVAALMDQALDMYLDRKQISTLEEQGEPFYHVPDEARVDVAFYRNNIIHLFVPESLLATALLGFGGVEIELGEAREQTHLLSRLFKYEWIYEERAEFENVFARTLAHFEASGWLTVEGDTIMLREERPAPLEFLRRVVASFLEAYAFMAGRLPELEGRQMERKDWVKSALGEARAAFLRGEILHYETISKPTFMNAARLFVDWSLITERRERGVSFTLSENGAREHADLQAHLQEMVAR